jgi:hypothetical protein
MKNTFKLRGSKEKSGRVKITPSAHRTLKILSAKKMSPMSVFMEDLIMKRFQKELSSSKDKGSQF